MPTVTCAGAVLSVCLQEFLCAINGHVMKEPVKARTTGLVFELATIELWLNTRGGVCPITNTQLQRADLVPEDDLRNRYEGGGGVDAVAVAAFVASVIAAAGGHHLRDMPVRILRRKACFVHFEIVHQCPPSNLLFSPAVSVLCCLSGLSATISSRPPCGARSRPTTISTTSKAPISGFLLLQFPALIVRGVGRGCGECGRDWSLCAQSLEITSAAWLQPRQEGH